MGNAPRRAAVSLLLSGLLLGACGGTDAGAGDQRVRLEGAIAQAVSPLREKVGEDGTDHEALAEELTDLVNDMPPPDGTKEVIASGGFWTTDEPGQRHVGVETVVIPEQPRDDKPYCLGVIVDDAKGVLFSSTDAATVDNGCNGLDSADAVVRGAPPASD